MTRIKVELTIPLFYNDKTVIESNKLNHIKTELIDNFGGISITNNIGYWINNNIVYKDFNKVYTVICDNNKDNIIWFKEYKTILEKYLNQYEIFIIITEIDKL